MKHMIALLLMLALAAGACAEGSAVPGNRLGFELLERMSDGTQNLFISPVSLGYALSLAACGAQGETLEEMLRALEAEDALSAAGLLQPLAEAGLKQANAAFTARELYPDYIDTVSQSYDARFFPLESPKAVNEWVREHTDGLIDQLVDEQSPLDAALLLLNAIAMDAEWASPFEPEATRDRTFHAPAGDVETPFMGQVLTAEYAEGYGAQAVKLRYRNSGLYMLLVLPEAGGVPEMLSRLSDEGLEAFEFDLRSPESIIEGIVAQQRRYDSDLDEAALRAALAEQFTAPEPWRVSLSLPKLDITGGGSLADPLRELGIRRAFETDADFFAMGDTGLYIGDVIQKVRVQVDEEGTRAAAVTEIMMMDGMGMPGFDYEQAPVSMVLDRPFILLIADEATGAVCFAGVVANPAAQ